MRLSLGLLLPALASAAQAAAPIEAYTFSASQPPTTETLDITPKQFRLVLAQRLGLARYHSIGDGRDVDAETVQTINRFGRQRSLFPADNEASPDLILALYTTDKEADEIRAELESHRYLAPAFSLNDAPGGQFDTLLKDFSDQITDIRGTLQIPDLASLKELLDGESGPLVIKHVTVRLLLDYDHIKLM